jgi:hypothetical protein
MTRSNGWTVPAVSCPSRKVLGELLAEAKHSSGGGGKLRSVIVEPTPETVESGRAPLLFGQASAPLQYNFSVIAFFEDE